MSWNHATMPTYLRKMWCWNPPKRDTKGLYERAFLPENHPDKIHNLTGGNDTFEIPENPDLVIDTSEENLEDSLEKCWVLS